MYVQWLNIMIKSLEIKNFAAYKKAKLNFSKGLNFIISPSDKGKSAILKALVWGLTNKPNSSGFRPLFWDGDTQINIDLFNPEDISIKRVKGKTKNYYELLNYYNQENFIFKSFKQDVPEEIKKIINISDINIQRQIDSPFLISFSSGEVARYFNKIIGLDKIDNSLKYINTKIRSKNSLIVSEKNNLKEYRGKQKEYDWIKEAEKILIKAEVLEEEIINKKQNNKILKKLLEEINYNKLILTKFKNLDEVELLIKKADKLDNELIKKEQNLLNLETIVEQIKDCKTSIDSYKNILKQKENIDKVFILKEDINNLNNKKRKISLLFREIKRTKQEYKTLSHNIKIIEKKLKEITPDICPLCNQKIRKEK